LFLWGRATPARRRCYAKRIPTRYDRSALATVVVIAVTKNMALAALPRERRGSVTRDRAQARLRRERDRDAHGRPEVLRGSRAPLGVLSRPTMDLIDKGLALVLSL